MLSFLMGKRRGRRGEKKMGGEQSKTNDPKSEESKAQQPTASNVIAENTKTTPNTELVEVQKLSKHPPPNIPGNADQPTNVQKAQENTSVVNQHSQPNPPDSQKNEAAPKSTNTDNSDFEKKPMGTTKEKNIRDSIPHQTPVENVIPNFGNHPKMAVDDPKKENARKPDDGNDLSICPSAADQEREHELTIAAANFSDGCLTVNRVAASGSAKSLKDLEKSRQAFFRGLLEDTVEEIYPDDIMGDRGANTTNFDEVKTAGDNLRGELVNDANVTDCPLTNKFHSTNRSDTELQDLQDSTKLTQYTLYNDANVSGDSRKASNSTEINDCQHLENINLNNIGSIKYSEEQQSTGIIMNDQKSCFSYDNSASTGETDSCPPEVSTEVLLNSSSRDSLITDPHFHKIEEMSRNLQNSTLPSTDPPIIESDTGEITQNPIEGIYFANAVTRDDEILSLRGNSNDSDVNGVDLASGQTSKYAAHERAVDMNENFERRAPNFDRGNEDCEIWSCEPVFKRFDSLEPDEQAAYGIFESEDGEDEESGFCGDQISANDNSLGDKYTDSGIGNDAELDENLKTELDISLDESDEIISEVKIDGEKPEGEFWETVGNSDGNDVGKEPADGDVVVGVAGQSEGSEPVGTVPVQSAAPRDEPTAMLTVSNLNESFPGKLTLSSALSSSSDESIGTKVKKRVRWADTDEGRSLESYDEYSSSDEDSSGDDEGEFEDVVESVGVAARGADGDEDDDDDEEASEEEEDEETDAEEIKTGTDETFTNSEISVTVEQLTEENVLKDEEEDEDSSEGEEEESEGDEDDEEDQEEEEKNETDQKTDEEDLVEKLTRLQEELLAKAASLERAQSGLDAAVLEADRTQKKLDRMQDQLDRMKRRNSELQQHIDENSSSSSEKERLELRISELERELDGVRNDRDRLEDRLLRLERDRNQEIQMVQQALERALGEQEAREHRYQKDFESERTLSSQRELQMLEDFEWKLRETEKNAKKKVESAEAEATKRIQDMEARLARAEADLERIAELKLCEIELKQLKVTSAEQRRTLRHVTRQYEELQVNEKILQEEVNRLRSALDKEKLSVTHLQALHKDELAEKERKLRVKLDVQASQITSEWEERLRRELAKLKSELENTHREEKIVAVDMAKLVKEQEIQNLKQGWERKSKEYKREIAEYKHKLDEKDVTYRQEIENAQTSSDRDTLDLRRKMDKLDMEYQSRIEKMQEEHEAQINEVKQECERKISQMEASYQLQAGTTRTTIELVKQQMTNENQTRIERMQAIHQQQMEEQWEMLETQRRNEVRALEDRHRGALEQLRKELDEIRKVQPPNSTQNSPPSSVIGSFFRYFSQAVTPTGGKQNGRQKTPIPESAKQMVIDQLNHEATNPFSCGDLDEIEAVGAGSDAEKILFAKLQQMTRQANEDKLEIERLKQRLEEKENVKQQQQPRPQQPHPPHPARRNRKRRN